MVLFHTHVSDGGFTTIETDGVIITVYDHGQRPDLFKDGIEVPKDTPLADVAEAFQTELRRFLTEELNPQPLPP